MFIIPEDIVIAKLVAHRSTESDKHLRDAQGVLTMQWGDVSLDLIRQAARLSGVSDTLEMIMEAARRAVEEAREFIQLE
jgi:hypothetical protein